MYTNQPHTTTRGSWHGEVAAVFSSLPLSTRGKTNILSVIFFFFTESCHGCWEDGLPHEPRSLLFKALHNLLER